MKKLQLGLLLMCVAMHLHAQENEKRDTLLLQPIEINTVRASEKFPVTQSMVTTKELAEKNAGQDLPFLLNNVPGVVANSDAGNAVGYTGIRIRGTDATRINITLNGIPYNDAESQGSFFVDLPDIAASAASIQVQRGVGTSSNGAGAFGASINLYTNKPEEKFYSNLETYGGSFNTWRHAFRVGSGLIGKHFTIDARLSSITSDGFIDRATSDLKSIFTSAAYSGKSNSFRINFFTGKERTYQAWYGIPESFLDSNRTFNAAGTEQPLKPYENEVDNYNQTHYQGFYNQRLKQNWNLQTAFFFTRGKGYYEQYKAAESISDYGIAGNASTDLVRRLYLDNDFYGSIFSVQYKNNGNELTLGGGANRYNGKHYGIVTWAETGIPANYKWYDLRAYKTDVSIYGKILQSISPKLFLFADLQMRNVVYSIGGFRDHPDLYLNNKFNFLNPKFGFTWISGKNKVFISYAQANKEPNRDDFEANTNQQPLPERLHDLEIGYQWKNSASVISATLYGMDYDDQLILTGKINDVGAYTRTNIRQSYRAGIELEAKHKLYSWLEFSGNLCVSTNKVLNFKEYADDYDNGGQVINEYRKTDIAYSPSVTAVGEISVVPLKNLTVNITGKYVGKQFLDNTSNKNRQLDAFFVNDLRLNYKISNKFFKESSFIFQVNNLFDEKYEPNGYTFSYIYGGKLQTENYFFPMAGRNFMAGVRVQL